MLSFLLYFLASLVCCSAKYLCYSGVLVWMIWLRCAHSASYVHRFIDLPACRHGLQCRSSQLHGRLVLFYAWGESWKQGYLRLFALHMTTGLRGIQELRASVRFSKVNICTTALKSLLSLCFLTSKLMFYQLVRHWDCVHKHCWQHYIQEHSCVSCRRNKINLILLSSRFVWRWRCGCCWLFKDMQRWCNEERPNDDCFLGTHFRVVVDVYYRIKKSTHFLFWK